MKIHNESTNSSVTLYIQVHKMTEITENYNGDNLSDILL